MGKPLSCRPGANSTAATPHSARGLTLLELLVTVAIVAALAGIAARAFQSTYADSQQELTRSEMQRVASAIRQFKQDTAYDPKQGPFRSITDGGLVNTSNYPGDTIARRNAWMCSPANFGQLINEPLRAVNTPVMAWNEATGRGWRGPYLTRDALVDVGDDLLPGGTGDPAITSDVHYIHMRGIGDGFEHPPVDPSGTRRCTEVVNNTACLLDWRIAVDNADDIAEGAEQAFDFHGGPLLYFINEDDSVNNAKENIAGCTALPCLVSMGANGFYERDGNLGDDDIVLVVP
ncbi:MAG: prepilin-type N-terminal cleavage/methylation domain-containing protein [Gammaproteobacteria bacterium]|jgi:prepilin-type N-terminal cleavage/methylation domain-containing protein